ncbi:MAG TPA: c-type cytochrome [Rubrivivax sp.]|nr:c-type cytochrome [Rubrivivax sp.]HPO18156.1 c-type cytochrome [Rubrivivax sp.]
MKTALTLLLALSTIGFAAQAQEASGDAARGAKINAACTGCHGITGYQASFPEVYRVPAISGQNAKYLVAALEAYKKGERKHPTMHAMAQTLSEQDIADLAAYYSQQGADLAAAGGASLPAPPAEVAELLTKGACASCHGEQFNKPIDGAYPKIAGQYPDYLFAALKAYKTEGNPKVGRGNAIMAAQVKQFSNKELKAIAQYLGTLPADVHTIAQSKFR